tara:strand:+ start:429 stop:608 length:180 start_codon:yes stop_codon:yes gene_type:complete
VDQERRQKAELMLLSRKYLGDKGIEWGSSSVTFTCKIEKGNVKDFKVSESLDENIKTDE